MRVCRDCRWCKQDDETWRWRCQHPSLMVKDMVSGPLIPVMYCTTMRSRTGRCGTLATLWQRRLRWLLKLRITLADFLFPHSEMGD
jgi:hypothetical protein